MLFKLLITSLIITAVVCNEGHVSKPYVFPIPFELPTRNDKADQCWVRIENVELVETVAIYCYIAHKFLENHIRDFNSRQMTADDVDVSLWKERVRIPEEIPVPKDLESNGRKIKDWKTTTILDPNVHLRIYVPQSSDCHLVMYSREATTNYKVDCEKLLYFLNFHMASRAESPRSHSIFIAVVSLILLIIIM